MDEPDKQLEQLKGLWETCQTQDDQKQTLITVGLTPQCLRRVKFRPSLLIKNPVQSLFSHVKDLNDQLKELKRELKLQRGQTEYLLDKNEGAQNKISSLVHEKACFLLRLLLHCSNL